MEAQLDESASQALRLRLRAQETHGFSHGLDEAQAVDLVAEGKNDSLSSLLGNAWDAQQPGAQSVGSAGLGAGGVESEETPCRRGTALPVPSLGIPHVKLLVR